ncbi:hypothetical protein [Paenibacillus sp.]|jgi:hypothetical protein|uniref:hypothetical protein n=1 Tax=Paenibacillus sp. TaxID=58172 RepID=UPI002817EB43|nr:hypothetical protein [Paenibacillus sp.]MDR0268431.1 hypothetical protein [Paenibacillus sp.]
MNNFRKTFLVGSLSCILALGGLSFAYTAIAASDTQATPSSEVITPSGNDQQDVNNHRRHGHHGRKFMLFKDTATLLDMTEKDLKKEWEQGKSLQQIAKEKKNWDADVFVQKLTAVQSTKIDNAVKAGKMTEQQADQLKQKLPGSLKRFTQHKYHPSQSRKMPSAHSEI